MCACVIEGSKSPENDISFIKIEPANGSDYMTQNEPRSYYAYVQNNGKTPVTSFTLSTNSKTASQTVKKELKFEGLNIPNNVPQKLKLDGIAIPVEGNVQPTSPSAR